ncbi:MAG: hypothetical protein R3F02_01145 [Thiolinea sp.]
MMTSAMGWLARLTPLQVFVFLLLVVFATQFWGVNVLTGQPWTGIRAQLLFDQPGTLHVREVMLGSPAEQPFKEVWNQHPGNPDVRTLAELKWDGQSIPLDYRVRTEPLSVRTYAEFARYLDLQQQLHQAFSSGKPLSFVLGNGLEVSVTPRDHTPLSGIPTLYWQLFAVNLLGLMIGTVVWMYRPYRLEAFCLFIAGLSYYCFESLFAVLIAREFYFPAGLMRALTSLEATFLNLFVWALFLILAYYPNHLLPKRAVYLISLLAVFLSLNYHFQWLELPFHSFVFQFVPIYLFGVWLIYQQWVQSERRPLDRTAALVLQMSAVLPCGIIMVFYSVPVIMGQPPILGIISTRLILLSIFIGWAVGILRFRLFDVEYWWFKSLLWIIGGVLVFLLDVLSVSLLQLSERFSLGLAVVLAGFLYFPLRQGLLQRVLPDRGRELADFLPDFSIDMAKAVTSEHFEDSWQSALRKRFQPLDMRPLDNVLEKARLEDNGLTLLVPDLAGKREYRLSGKQHAARLFNQRDTQMVDSLLTIARMTSNASEMRHKAIAEERQRIMHDLHDTVGAKLMTVAHRLKEPEGKQDVRDALATLRDTIRLSLKETPLYLEEHLADWRAEIGNRAEAAGVELVWQQHGIGQQSLLPRQVFELTQILRELVSNALRHAEPTALEVTVGVEAGVLQFRVSNDGKVTAPEEWRSGTGLQTLEKRIKKLGGQLSSSLHEVDSCRWLWVEFGVRLEQAGSQNAGQ